MPIGHHLGAKILEPARKVLLISSQIELGDVTKRGDLLQSRFGRLFRGLALAQPHQERVECQLERPNLVLADFAQVTAIRRSSVTITSQEQ